MIVTGLLASGTWDFVTPAFACFLPVALLGLGWGFIAYSRRRVREINWAIAATGCVLAGCHWRSLWAASVIGV